MSDKPKWRIRKSNGAWIVRKPNPSPPQAAAATSTTACLMCPLRRMSCRSLMFGRWCDV